MNTTTFTTNNTTLRCTPFIWQTSSYSVYTIIGCESAPCQLTSPFRPCQHLGPACRETIILFYSSSASNLAGLKKSA